MSWLSRLGFVAPAGAAAAAASDESALLARLHAGDGDALALVYRRESGAADLDAPHWLRRLAWGAGGLGATCAALLCAMLLLDPPGTLHSARAATPAGSGFIPLVPEAEFRAALAASRDTAVWLQPAELPRERLALLGLPFDAGRADETVHAELMLNPNGQVLAVRILN